MAKVHKPIICFKQVVRDSITYIDAQVGNTRKAAKDVDTIEWQVINQTTKDLFVAVVDFWAAAGGTPFTDGDIPQASAKIVAGSTGTITKLRNAKPVKTEGDAATYKYTVLVTTDAAITPTTLWMLARDPEMEIEP